MKEAREEYRHTETTATHETSKRKEESRLLRDGTTRWLELKQSQHSKIQEQERQQQNKKD